MRRVARNYRLLKRWFLKGEYPKPKPKPDHPERIEKWNSKNAEQFRILFTTVTKRIYLVPWGNMSTSDPIVEFGKVVIVHLNCISDNGQITGSFSVELKWWDTITTVRNIIAQRTGIPHKQIDIIYEGKKLHKAIALYQLKVKHNQIKLLYYFRSVAEGKQTFIRIIADNKEVDNVRNRQTLHF